jgi:hypothetical protein
MATGTDHRWVRSATQRITRPSGAPALSCGFKETPIDDLADEPPPLLHPGMADLYRQKVTDLAQALEHPDTRTEAAEAIRGLIDAIVLTPTAGALEAHVVRRGRRAQAETAGQESGLQIELIGNLAAMLSAAKNAPRSPETGDL